VGCSSTPFTRSERCTSLRLMSRRSGMVYDFGLCVRSKNKSVC
jgi:hypothetical protein